MASLIQPGDRLLTAEGWFERVTKVRDTFPWDGTRVHIETTGSRRDSAPLLVFRATDHVAVMS